MTAVSLTGGQYLTSKFDRAGFLISVLVLVSRNFELGRIWLVVGVGRQSRTG